MYGVMIEAGNCIYCGKHIDDGSDIFLCEECRRKEEERKCLHEKLKEGAIATARPGKPTTAKGPKQRPTGREERLKHLRKGGRSEGREYKIGQTGNNQ